MNHPRAACLTLLCSFALFSGCAIPQRGVPVQVRGESKGEPIALDVENLHGGVIIDVDPSAAAPRLSIEGPDGAATWAAAQIDEGEVGPILRVLVQPKAGIAPAQASLRVTVPAIAGARVRTAGGPIVVSGARGAVDAQTGDDLVKGGMVRVSYAQPIDSPVLIRSSAGNVLLEAPVGSRGLLVIQSPVAPRFDGQGQACAFHSTAGGAWSCDLGPGGFEIKLIADLGSATVRLKR
ncbi:MAG: hypothetical protein IT433_10455 [Phycisphaerales bacterium]|nr:hypothetical protein [Phycisphaerales bacterium]